MHALATSPVSIRLTIRTFATIGLLSSLTFVRVVPPVPIGSDAPSDENRSEEIEQLHDGIGDNK
jgi:hypothetical protein